MGKPFIFTLVIIFLFCGFLLVRANAEEFSSQKYLEDEVKIIEPGLLPNSFWYWSDRFAEETKYLFTFSKEKKADFLIELAEERLAEMKVLSERGITSYVDRLLTKHEHHIKKAEELYDELKKEGKIKAEEYQDELESEILETEYDIRRELNKAPVTYEKKRDGALGWIKYQLGKLTSHLGKKKTEISNERASYSE
jgi:hypothetical protein